MRILQGHQDTIRCLSYSPDGKLLAAGDEAGVVRLWRLLEGACDALRNDDNAAAGSVEAVAFDPSGRYLVASLPTELVRWDVHDGKVVSRAESHAGGTRGLAWSPDGLTLASAGWDRKAMLWSMTLSRRVSAIDTPEPLTAVRFTPLGKTFVVAGNAGALLVYPASGKPPPIAAKHARGLFSLAVSPDGALIAAGDARGDIALWHTSPFGPLGPLSGHTWTVYGLAFTPDGRTLVSGGADGTVRLWDVAARRCRDTFRWHSRWVTCLAVAPDGMTAAAGSADGTVVLWDLADA